ncbi:hypothetical protein MAPG_09518 [Magnaporthiopsis poae ATCC 64411]|uniref:Uncharacterized protein n=1 Tax=Magnaporthiopsis poae (strain ATCC 64411 / 73-15) TaxID=644358 RepID=A0A0C4EA59_MAGP6|nr:hypothetical protein MAPG_09518 [Magnaporthiopsis poae ATCC 64411]
MGFLLSSFSSPPPPPIATLSTSRPLFTTNQPNPLVRNKQPAKMQFSNTSIAAVAMALFSLASAAPTDSHLDARGNCFGDAVAKGARCVMDCMNEAGAGNCVVGCNANTLGELATCLAGKSGKSGMP